MRALRPARLPKPVGAACRSLATQTEIALTEPLLVYRGLVATGKVRYDSEQMRALVQVRRVHWAPIAARALLTHPAAADAQAAPSAARLPAADPAADPA